MTVDLEAKPVTVPPAVRTDAAVALRQATTTPSQVRQLCREDKLPTTTTTGMAPGYAQANVIIVPQRYADDFRDLCIRNPVPCPLLGETRVGDPTVPPALAKDSDIRTDCAWYNVYTDGKFVEKKRDIKAEWQSDSVAFFIGCSYTFESALTDKGLGLRHQELGRHAPVYVTTTQLFPAGVFKGRMVVSMRPFPADKIEEVREATRPFIRTHGEPVAWGPEGAAQLGIDDVYGKRPVWGSPSEMKEGEIPVYWGCGVTPQQIVMDSKLPGTFMSHSAGSMLVLDMRVADACH